MNSITQNHNSNLIFESKADLKGTSSINPVCLKSPFPNILIAVSLLLDNVLI